MEKAAKKTPPPYVTYKSFSNFINGLRENGTPSHITKAILPGSNSGKATMSASLKALGLVKANEEPSESLIKLTNPNENYKAILKEVITGSYDFLTDPDFDILNTTTDKVAERFKAAGAGGSTITKCMAFFLSACQDAGIEVSRYVKAPTPDRRGGTRRKPSGNKRDREPDPSTEGGRFDEIPEGMERITVPLRGMEDGVIYFPSDLEEDEAKKAVKMAVFILNNFYGISD